MKSCTGKNLTKKDVKKIILRTCALLTIDEGYLLYNLAKQCNGDIVEIGSYKGGSTVFLAKGLKEPHKVYAIDPHDFGKFIKTIGTNKKLEKVPEDTFPIFEKNLIEEKVRDKVIPIVNTSENAVKNWKKKIAFLWIDGNHDYDFVKKDFLLWEPFLEIGGIIAFHDSADSKKKSPVTGESTGRDAVGDGPYNVAREYIFNSKRFIEIKIIDSITYAKKIRNNNLIELIKNKIEIKKYIVSKIYHAADRKIGIIGLYIKKISPKTYFVLNKFNFLKD